MTDFTRIISITSLVFLAFFCFQTGLFLCTGHIIKKNSRRTLVIIEFFTGFLLLFDALAYFYRGNITNTGWHMVRLSNFFVFICNFSASFFFCFYVCEFIKQSRLDFSILLNPKKSVENGIPVHLFIVLFFCLVGILLTIISQFTGLLYYFDEKNLYHRSTFYPLGVALGFLPGLITISMLIQNRKKNSKKCICFACGLLYSSISCRNFDSLCLWFFMDKYFPWIRLAASFLFFYKVDGA